MKPTAGFWKPTPSQELLLKSALFPREKALVAWERWISIHDIETIDTGSQGLLSLVYANLTGSDCGKKIVIDRLRSVYKKYWYFNHLLLETAARLIGQLQEQGIPVLLLKGMGLILTAYPHPALRPMTDFDILVPWSQARSAGDFLESREWKIKSPSKFPLFGERSMVLDNSWGYVNQTGHNCDLHWSVIRHHSFPGADDRFWIRAVTVRVKNIKVLTLSPEDHLLKVLEHGAYWSRIPPVRWVADAFYILKSARSINWDYFLSQTRHLSLTVAVRKMLSYLREQFYYPIPADLINELKDVKTSGPECRLYQNMIKPKLTIRGYVSEYRLAWIHYQVYLREYKKVSEENRLFDFFRFLRFRWNLKKTWLIPLAFPIRVFILMRRFLSRVLNTKKRG